MLKGQVNVPQNDPMLTGELTANYTFGAGEVGGTLSSSLKVPHDTGKYVDLSSGTIDYHFDSNGYGVGTQDGAGPSGRLFNLVDMNGSFDVDGSYSTALQSAQISGALNYYLTGNSYYPESFTEAGGWEASGILDFGYNIAWDVLLASEYSLSFDESGFDGAISAGFSADAWMYIDWPNLPLFGDTSDLPILYEVHVGANAEIYKRDNGQIWLEGSEDTCDGDGGATFTYNDESKDAPIYCYLWSI